MFQWVGVPVTFDGVGVGATWTAAASWGNTLTWLLHSTRMGSKAGRETIVYSTYLMVGAIQLALIHCAMMSSDETTCISSTVVHQRRLLIVPNPLYGQLLLI